MRARPRLSVLFTAGLLLVALAPAPGQAVHYEGVVRPTTVACPPERVTSSADNGFTDVPGLIFEREVNCLRDYGIAYGRSPGTYAPGDPVSRRQMALFLSRLVEGADLPSPALPVSFSDLGGLDAATRHAVETVAGLGIAAGKADGRFAPDELVTRDQMATFLDKTHGAIAGRTFDQGHNVFNDSHGVHGVHVHAIGHAGIAGGVAPRWFAGDRLVTRGQMAAFLARLLDLEVEAHRLPWAYGGDTDPLVPVFTSTGLRCTVVGTEGDDVITGTDGPDVLCGRGGDDGLNGLGAGDVLDGGSGIDRMAGGPGTDLLLGGDGDDTLRGDDGDDQLWGEDEDDLLEGGAGADLVDGGPGANRCPPAVEDERVNCGWDVSPPTIVSVESIPASVDVTEADAEVVVRVHATDDMGVSGVGVIGHGTEPDDDYGRRGPFFGEVNLVSGTPVDGVWEIRGIVRRHSEPDDYDLDVRVDDRVGNTAGDDFLDLLQVISADPDREPPKVLDVTVRPADGALPLDVTSASATLVVEARITDDKSGIPTYERYGGWAPPLVCLDVPQADGSFRPAGGCSSMELVSGDAHDGVHRGTYTVHQGAASGDWNVRLLVSDRVGSAWPDDTVWLGPDAWAAFETSPPPLSPHTHPLPGGVGRVPIRSSASTALPSISEVTVTPASLDSRFEDTLVTVAVRAQDLDGDLRAVHGFLSTDGPAGPSSVGPVGQSQISGDGHDGWWRLDFLVPQGTPPGSHYLAVFVEDAAGHTRRYMSPSDPAATAPLLPGPGVVTVTS